MYDALPSNGLYVGEALCTKQQALGTVLHEQTRTMCALVTF